MGNKLWQWIVSGAVLIGGMGTGLYTIFHNDRDKNKKYSNLNHCKVPKEWESIRNEAWLRASSTLAKAGLNPVTKCKSIVVEAGIKVNPKTGQWGRPTMLSGKEYWYAGLGSTTKIQIVGTPEKKPYNRSEPILAHEVGETILNMNPEWAGKSIDERNKFLWSLGL